MSNQADPKELLKQVDNDDLRSQLETVFGELSGSALRQQVDTLKDENKNLKGTLRNKAFQEAGFEYDAEKGEFTGPGKAIAKLYDGEPDPTKIREFATEYGINPTGGEQSQQVDTSQARASGEDRLGQLNTGTIPARDPSPDDLIKQAEADGDWATYDRLQAQKIESLRQG